MPAGRFESVRLATPFTTGTVPTVVAPLRKVMVPVAGAPPGEATVAVRVTGVIAMTWPEEMVRVVVVLADEMGEGAGGAGDRVVDEPVIGVDEVRGNRGKCQLGLRLWRSSSRSR